MNDIIQDLVRVVAKDGSVWWTRPEHVKSHEDILQPYCGNEDSVALGKAYELYSIHKSNERTGVKHGLQKDS